MSLIAFADNTDPALQYSGVWSEEEDKDALNGTLSVTVKPGSTVTFPFSGTTNNFHPLHSLSEVVTGSQIAVIGALTSTDRPSFQAEFTIDGSSPVIFVSPANVTEKQEAVTFFESQPLPDSQHVLFINVTFASQDAPFSFDGLNFYPTSIQTMPNASYAISSLIPAATAPAGVTGGVIQPSKSTPIGAIVGGVIGGLAVLVLATTAIVYFCYRHRRARPYYYSSADAVDLLHHGM